MCLLYLLTGQDHFVHEIIDLFLECIFQILKRFISLKASVIRSDLLSCEQTDSAGHCGFQRLIQIKHGRIAPSEVISLCRQLHASNDGIIHGIFFFDPKLHDGRDHCFVIKKLRHSATL